MVAAADPAGAHELVLVGGGHTHVQILTDFAARPMPSCRLTLVTDRLLTPYSGMLPGHVAGLYRHEEMHIDLARLAQAARARLIHAPAEGLDRREKLVCLEGAPPLPYDTLSLDIGITPDLGGIAGAERHGLAVKPIGSFLHRLEPLLASAAQPDGPRRFAVVGGGAAGIEIAFALNARLHGIAEAHRLGAGAFAVTLVSGEEIAPSLNEGARRHILAHLAGKGIAVISGFRVAGIDPTGIRAQDGRVLAAEAVLIATAARAPSWLGRTDLPLAPDGSVRTRRTLQVLDDEAVFAVGDCAVVTADPRPKAGVFAVRQGPTLAANLRARLRGGAMREHVAQRAYLTLLMTGGRHAIAARGRWFSLEGRLVWHWKDLIDRRFMARFSAGR